MSQPVLRDERTLAVENASFRWAYLVLSYGLLASIAWRSFALHEQSWDLLALVVVGGFVATAYQGSLHILSRRWATLAAGAAVLAALVAVIAGFLHRR